MDMRETFRELATPYCTKHKCEKRFSKDLIGGSWICPECAGETGEAFKLILSRLRACKEEETVSSTLKKLEININIEDMSFEQLLEEMSKKWQDIE